MMKTVAKNSYLNQNNLTKHGRSIMTKQLLHLAALVLLVAALFNNPAYATTEKGDTLVIHMSDQAVTPWNEIIAADTAADGSQAHSVYELDPADGGWYPISSALVLNSDVAIIGGKRTAGQERPKILEKLNAGAWWMITANGSITFEGVHIMQIEETLGGNIGSWARAGLLLNSENCRVVIRDCIWDFTTGFSALINKNGLSLKVTNSLFRFNKPLDNGVWAGQGIDISAATLDTVIIQNCTWYGGGPFMLKTWESTENLFRMDHCSIVDFVQWPIHGVHWVNSEFTNNLFYNAYTMGEDATQIKGQDLDQLPFGVINIDTIYYDYNADSTVVTPNMTKEATRNLLVSNNNNFVKQNIKDYWAIASSGDTIYHGFVAPDPNFYDGFMNSRTRAMFENDVAWPGLVLENTTSLDPQFQNYFDYSDTLVNYSKYYYKYAWPDAKATAFMTDPDGEPLSPTDPMVYNLKVTNTTLRTASTSGGPIGDLTWELASGYNSTQAEIATDVKEINSLPTDFVLDQNYPNPFNPSTTINFSVNKASNVKLTVYNMLGQKVATLVDNFMNAGSYEVKFNASRLASGVYFYSLEAGSFKANKKMMLLK
jgi:hypothetical protein